MAGELFAGAALGAAFNSLMKLVAKETTSIVGFKDQLKRLETTLTDIRPKLIKITELRNDLGYSQEEKITQYLKDAADLVIKCSKVKWWNKSSHAKMLTRLDNDLVRLFQVNAQADAIITGMETSIEIGNMHKKIDRLLAAETGGLSNVPGLPQRSSIGSLSDATAHAGGCSGSRDLQTSIDSLDESPMLKECCLDLSLFPENKKISAAALGDIWQETRIPSLLKDGCPDLSIDALDESPILKEFYLDVCLFPEDEKIAAVTLKEWSIRYIGYCLRNFESEGFLDVFSSRENATDAEFNCNEYYVKRTGLHRELACHLSTQDPESQTERFLIDIHGDVIPQWWETEATRQPINSRAISISTDEAFSSSWNDLDAPNAEALILNIRSKDYALPQFIQKMSKLKVLIVTGYGVDFTKIGNLHFLRSLTNLKRIRFEHVSVSPTIQAIFTLQELKKISFVNCKIGDALKSGTTEYPYMLPNLLEFVIDRCYDLKELPAELCSFVHPKKLSVTNCRALEGLPKGLGSLSNLQTVTPVIRV